MQRPGSASPREPLTGVTRYSPVCGVQAFAGAAEGRQQEVKCRGRQASESQTPALVAPEFCVGHHKAMVLLFGIKSTGWRPTAKPVPLPLCKMNRAGAARRCWT